jgi:hypothetical protein
MNDDLKTKEQDAKPESAQGQTAPPTPPTNTVQANPTGKTTEYAQKSRRQPFSPILRLARIIRKRSEFPKWTDIAIVILTGGIVYYAHMQHRDLIEAGIQTDKIIAADERLARAMEDNVKQAGDALKATIDQAHLDQRAWLGIKSIHIDTPEPDKNVVVRVILSNSGKTLANKVRGYAILAIPQSKTLLNFPEPPKEPIQSVGIYWPGLDFGIDASGTAGSQSRQFTFTKTGIDNLNAKRLFLFVYGTYTYSDIFDHPHTTVFCARYSTDSKNFEVCANHNYAD